MDWGQQTYRICYESKIVLAKTHLGITWIVNLIYLRFYCNKFKKFIKTSERWINVLYNNQTNYMFRMRMYYYVLSYHRSSDLSLFRWRFYWRLRKLVCLLFYKTSSKAKLCIPWVSTPGHEGVGSTGVIPP